jgi:hypothetical protein
VAQYSFIRESTPFLVNFVITRWRRKLNARERRKRGGRPGQSIKNAQWCGAVQLHGRQISVTEAKPTCARPKENDPMRGLWRRRIGLPFPGKLNASARAKSKRFMRRDSASPWKK